MKKLRLNVEEMSVETFRVENADEKERGTVMAHAEYSGTCAEGECGGGGGGGTYITDCDDSAHYSCYNSCFIHGSCNSRCP